jgi:hypothetical protein
MTQFGSNEPIKVPTGMVQSRAFVEYVTNPELAKPTGDLAQDIQKLTQVLALIGGSLVEVLHYLGTNESAGRLR